MAYASDESAQPGQSSVFVQAMPLTSARYPIGRGGVPRWSRDGRSLYFVTATEKGPKLMVVPVTTTSGFEAGAPREALDLSGLASSVEPAPDGRFIGAVPRPSEPDDSITIVLNWKP